MAYRHVTDRRTHEGNEDGDPRDSRRICRCSSPFRGGAVFRGYVEDRYNYPKGEENFYIDEPNIPFKAFL